MEINYQEEDRTFGEGLDQDQIAPPAQPTLRMQASKLYYSNEEEGGPSQTKAQSFSESEQKLAKKMPLVLRMPNTAFGIALGLGGNAILWKRMQLTEFTSFVGDTANSIFWFACISVWVFVSVCYAAKAHCFPNVVMREWSHPVRTHFFNCPHIALLMLAIGVPVNNYESTKTVMTASFCLCIVVQTFLTQRIYRRWLFGKKSNIGQARAPFLLSVIGWLLLSVLGQTLDIHKHFGINVPAMCFGAGMFLYVIVVISIFMNLHTAKGEKGSPAMFLLLAPPAVASSAMAGFSHHGRFGDAPCAIFGWCVVVLLLLLSLSPQLLTKPLVLGTYWAYVFPLAALATAAVQYADTEGSIASEIMAWFFIFLATAALILVFLRMSWHHIAVLRGLEVWGDPVFEQWEMGEYKEEKERVAASGTSFDRTLPEQTL